MKTEMHTQETVLRAKIWSRLVSDIRKIPNSKLCSPLGQNLPQGQVFLCVEPGFFLSSQSGKLGSGQTDMAGEGQVSWLESGLARAQHQTTGG